MLRYFVLYVMITLLCKVNAQNISFYKEHITFKIENGYFHVNGTYYLKNNQNASNQIALFYPFPVDTLYSKADSLTIYCMEKNQEITDYKLGDRGVLFTCEVDSVVTLLISYQQKLNCNEARYLLTTTKQWMKPLEEATFELIVPDEIQITSFSYPPDRSLKIGNEMLYYWQKENFMPEEDMIFIFN